MKHLNLEEIKNGCPGLSTGKASSLYESCIITLTRQKHNSGGKMLVTGEINDSITLEWTGKITGQLERTYADQQEATEDAATCMAILLGLKLKGYTVVERSIKSTGIDYWLGHTEDILFQKKARLEVSGIFDGDEKKLAKRYREKCLQTRPTDNLGLPAYISVTNFREPQTQFGKKK